MSTIYNQLAKYYDDLVKDEEATKEWVHWICSFLKPSSILELACGSGEITLALADLGYKVDALDISEEMVEKAANKDTDHRIHFMVRDMKDLLGLEKYDGILCLCDSFNYLLSQEEVMTLFEQVYEHLNEGGLFFFDMHSLDRIEEFKEEFNETGQMEDGCQYQWSIMSEDDIIYQDFAFYMPDGSCKQEHHMQKVFDPVWILEMLSKYFSVISIKTDFVLEGIQEGEKYFYICEKRVVC